MTPRRLSILGVGLLGGSIGLALREANVGCRVVGYGHRRATLDAALDLGAIDEAATDPAAAVAGADVVVLCTPVGSFRELLSAIAPALLPGTLVTDVGSTKRSVVAAAEELLPGTIDFVGSHPMAGSEKRGVEFAHADLFRNALCILTPTPATPASATERCEALWRLLGMRTTRLDAADHDRLLADVSHLPHAVAAALVAMQDDAALPLAGNGFLDATRIAGGDGGLWRDILLDNRDAVKASLSRLRATLDKMTTLLDADDQGAALAAWLDAAAARREALLRRRVREIGEG